MGSAKFAGPDINVFTLEHPLLTWNTYKYTHMTFWKNYKVFEVKKPSRNNFRDNQILPIQIPHDGELHRKRNQKGGKRNHWVPTIPETRNSYENHWQKTATWSGTTSANNAWVHSGTIYKGIKPKRHPCTHHIHPSQNSESARDNSDLLKPPNKLQWCCYQNQ